MSKRALTKVLFYLQLCLLAAPLSQAQCPVSTTQSQLNWDWLDFLPSANANYTPSYVFSITPYNQNFTIGTRRVNFTMAPSGNITLNGENATNTAHAASFATAGDDVEFVTTNAANTTIIMNFDVEVYNVKFSLFDLDNNQRATITAVDALGLPVLVAVTKANVLSGITILGAAATAPGAGYANSDNNGTINVQVAAPPGTALPVKTITITLNNATGNIWLSDIDACVTESFPVGYRSISRPFTGMPSYMLTVVDNVFYQLDPATGRMKHVFTDPGHSNMNGMAYDPYSRLVYYTYSLTGTPANTKSIFRYNIDTETIGTFVADVNAAPLNIPTYTPGVTSGSASFYNGNLYIGFEASNSSRNSGRENTVWKVDFDAAQNPIRASQVYATRVDSNISGSDRLIHDWSDIGVTDNGMMYDFDGAGAGTSNRDSMYYHFDLMTGQRIQFLPNGAGNIGPKQLGIDWQENIYSMGGLPTSSGTAQNIGGFIVPYNYDGSVNSAQTHLFHTLPGPVYPIGSWGDGSEAFRPYCDFGDAPASYDPDPWSPAVHERDTALHIGATFDREWNKISSALANADGADEDGAAYVPILAPGGNNYVLPITVYNNTGVNATLIAWLDYDGNGIFDASEVCNAQPVVPSGSSIIPRTLFWPVVHTPLPNGSFTYLRIRMVKTADGMAAANATGYYDNGETEDYRVLVDNFPLTVTLHSFDAKLINKHHVKLDWTTSGEENFSGFDVQRSSDNNTWNTISTINATGNGSSAVNNYTFNDLQPLSGKSYYRLVMNSHDGKSRNSEIRTITIAHGITEVILFPNPAKDQAVMIVSAILSNPATVTMTNMAGKIVFSQTVQLRPGANGIDLPVNKAESGIYIVRLFVDETLFTQKLVISK